MSKIEQLRNKLHESIEKYGINAEETRKISVEIDKMLNERGYNESNLIYNKYLESMLELRKISKIFGKFPTIDEWNKYCLLYTSLPKNKKKILFSKSILF